MAKHFPIRKIVISSLSLGVVVTEARLKSGANITAAFALQQNREVFALPGRVDSEASAGTNRLISRQHAKLITRLMKFWRSYGSAGLQVSSLCCLWVKLKR